MIRRSYLHDLFFSISSGLFMCSNDNVC